MIITKKEFKDAVKNIIVDGINNTRQENVTEEKNAEADKKVATVLTDYYELTTVSGLVLNDRFSDNPEPLVFMENLACVASTGLLVNMLEEKMQKEEPQEKEFDVEEILKEAKGCE